MRRVALLVFVLIVLGTIGAGIFILTGHSSVATASSSTSNSSGDSKTTTLTNNSTGQTSTEMAPVSDTMYGSDVEELMVSTSQSSGRYCDGEKFESSGY